MCLIHKIVALLSVRLQCRRMVTEAKEIFYERYFLYLYMKKGRKSTNGCNFLLAVSVWLLLLFMTYRNTIWCHFHKRKHFKNIYWTIVVVFQNHTDMIQCLYRHCIFNYFLFTSWNEFRCDFSIFLHRDEEIHAISAFLFAILHQTFQR